MIVISLDAAFYIRAAAFPWLARCGERSLPELGLPVRWVESRTAALQSLLSTEWADANTHAGGELTSWLAKTDYDAYGAQWNKLFTQSWTLLAKAIGEILSSALESGGWPMSLAATPLPEITANVRASIGARMADLLKTNAWDQCLTTWILGNVNTAAIEMAFRKRFRKAPVFFERLLEVYESGHLPCGWEGDLDDWPQGVLMVH